MPTESEDEPEEPVAEMAPEIEVSTDKESDISDLDLHKFIVPEKISVRSDEVESEEEKF